MALTSTIHNFEIELADTDRRVYETLALRVALHPSEAPEHLWARVLAYCLEYEPGLEFSRGISAGDEPAIWSRDATGRIRSWIEVGTPDAARLHKAAKSADRVAVYTHKEAAALLGNTPAAGGAKCPGQRLYQIYIANSPEDAPCFCPVIEKGRGSGSWAGGSSRIGRSSAGEAPLRSVRVLDIGATLRR